MSSNSKTGTLFPSFTGNKSQDVIDAERVAHRRHKNKLARVARRKTRDAAGDKKHVGHRVTGLTEEQRAARDLRLQKKKEAGVKVKAFKAEKRAKLESEKEQRRNTVTAKVSRGVRSVFSTLLKRGRRRKGLL